MSHNTLRIDEEPDGPRLILHLVGELEVASSGVLREVLLRAATSHRQIVLDLTDVTFIDSSGIGTLAEASLLLPSFFCELRMGGLQPPIARIIEMAGLADHIPVVAVPRSTPGSDTEG